MTRSKYAAAIIAAAILSFFFSALGQAAVPDSLSYQGYLTDPAGSPIDGAIQFRFSIYNDETGGVPLWVVDQLLPVDQGLFTAELGGPHTPFQAWLFDTPLWLGIEVGADPEMTPRRPLTSAAFAFKADDALTLTGQSAAALDQSGHVTNTANPHTVTAGQAGAVATGTFSVHTADASAHHVKTSSFTELSGQVADPQIPANIARDAELTWGNLNGIPAGFADGVDNNSGGDITSITALPPLSGGGIVGSVTLGLQNPLALTGNLHLDTGSLGIGIANPNRKLYVVSDALGLGYALKLDNPHSPGIGQTGVGILFSTEGSGGGLVEPTRGKGGLAYLSTGTWNRGAFHFLQDSGPDENIPELADAVMTIANNGNVGVGTTSPQARLDVAGGIKVAGDIVWPAKKSYYNVPAVAFQPAFSDAQYQRRPDIGYFNTNPNFGTNAFAPVNLPHGATVVKVTSYWYDHSAADATLRLRWRDNNENVSGTMAEMATMWNIPGPCCDEINLNFDDSIDWAEVDNIRRKYYVEVYLPADADVAIFSVRIEYSTTGILTPEPIQ